VKKIVLFDPSYGTSNQGDFIINEAVMAQMKYLFNSNYLVRYSTHSPLMHLHQLLKRNFISRNCEPSILKFLGGSNMLKHDLFRYTLDWNVNIFTKNLYKNSVTIGVGSEGDPMTMNRYTRFIYKSLLSKKYVHSTRDEKTKTFIESLGLKAVNTGCPTTWNLSAELCAKIPSKKANNVIFTLTDYSKDKTMDQVLIDTLIGNYQTVYFWIQGTEDLEYLNSLKNIENIRLVNPNLESYSEVLNRKDIDYVGTRLHAGIYAMQHMTRSIILIIDNRTRDMQESYGLKAIERTDINDLDKMIKSEFKTDLRINKDKIDLWKSQFVNY
jgi:hypothetical protein